MNRLDPLDAGGFEFLDDIYPVAMPFDAWNYRPNAGWNVEQSLVGYHIEALDGGIGKVEDDSGSSGACYLAVDTGPWIFGRKVLLPAGIVTEIDNTERTVYVGRTKHQIKSSPEFDPDMAIVPERRSKISEYYSDTYAADSYDYAFGDVDPFGHRQ